MELATPPPAARAPVAWYSWWLMPLALGGGTVAATFMSSERIAVAAAGAAATAAGTLCVRLLVRTRTRLGRAEIGFRAQQAEHSQQWQQHVASLERKFAAERVAQEGERASAEGHLAEQAGAYEAQLAEQARAFEERLAAQAQSYEAQLADQAEVLREHPDQQQQHTADDQVLVEVAAVV
ncbi:ATP-binding protein, partial [Streptomyces sp. NPDC003832]